MKRALGLEFLDFIYIVMNIIHMRLVSLIRWRNDDGMLTNYVYALLSIMVTVSSVESTTYKKMLTTGLVLTSTSD